MISVISQSSPSVFGPGLDRGDFAFVVIADFVGDADLRDAALWRRLRVVAPAVDDLVFLAGVALFARAIVL